MKLSAKCDRKNFFSVARHPGSGIRNSGRIVVVTEFRSRRSRSRELDNLFDISLDKRSDGSGTIDFGQLEPENRKSGLAFHHLDGCASVYDIIAEARSQARSAAA